MYLGEGMPEPNITINIGKKTVEEP